MNSINNAAVYFMIHQQQNALRRRLHSHSVAKKKRNEELRKSGFEPNNVVKKQVEDYEEASL